MAQSAPVRAKIPTKNPQPSRAGVTRPAATAARPRRTGRSAFAAGTGRAVTRGDGRVVVEVEGGITVYPARRAGDRWRAVWYEGGRRRQCEAVAEDKLAAKLAKVAERLAADAPGLERPGADLIAWYLSPDRHPAGRAVVPQARRYPAAAVRAVRRPGHRGDLLPGHPGRRHAAHRQRRAHRGGGRAAAPVPVGHGHRGDRGRVPDQPPAARRCTGRPPGRAAPGPQVSHRRGIRPVRRPRRDPRRCMMSPGSAGPWPPGGAGTCMS